MRAFRVVVALVFLAAPSVAFSGRATVDLTGVSEAATRGVPETIVWIEAPDARPPIARPQAVLEQRNLAFSPHVLVVEVGTDVKFPNADRVFHNVFSFHDGKKFDLGLYPVGTSKDIPFDHPGLSRVFCNIHAQMAAYVMAVDTPYFTVSGADGRFTIEGLPPGTFVYHAWRAGSETKAGTIAVGDGATLDIGWP